MKLFSLFCKVEDYEKRFEQIRPRLYRVAWSWTRNPALAEDLTQETLEKGLKRIGQLNEAERFDSWMFSILTNCWRDHFRQHREMDDIDDIDESLVAHHISPEVEHSQNELVARVRDAVSRLPAGQRQVVTLIDLEEFSYLDVARILSIPIGTVMSRLCRARQALQVLLREHAPADMKVQDVRKVTAIRRVK